MTGKLLAIYRAFRGQFPILFRSSRLSNPKKSREKLGSTELARIGISIATSKFMTRIEPDNTVSADKNAELLSLLASQPTLAGNPLKSLEGQWSTRALSGESLAEWLVREGVFTVEAPRTLELVRRGFLSLPEVSALFREGGWDRLLDLLDLSQPAATTNADISPNMASVRQKPGELSKPNAAQRGMAATPATTGVTEQGLHQKLDDDGARNEAELPKTQPVFHSAGEPVTLNLHNSPTSVEEIRVGSLLGKCLLTEVIGRGGCGIVFRALHQSLNIVVAVKILNPSLAQSDRNLFNRLQAEAKLLAELNHPNIIRVFDFDVVPVPYVVLEHVDGLSLADLILQCGGLNLRRATDLIIQVAEALAVAWKAGIVHRDVKPGNILVTRHSKAKLADLGLAIRAVHLAGAPSASLPRVPEGTAAYMSPEQIDGEIELDCRSDIYSLGATFYHAATGVMPFTGVNCQEIFRKHQEVEPIPPSNLIPNLHPLASKIILRMMAKHSNARYQSYNELLLDLRRLAAKIQGASPASLPVNSDPQLHQSVSSHSGLWRSLTSLFGGSRPQSFKESKTW